MVTKILGHLVELFLLTRPPTTSCYQDHSAPKTQKQREVKTFYSNKNQNNWCCLRRGSRMSILCLRHTRAPTVSRATNEDDLMASTIAGQSSLKLSVWTSITGTTKDVIIVYKCVDSKKFAVQSFPQIYRTLTTILAS